MGKDDDVKEESTSSTTWLSAEGISQFSGDDQSMSVSKWAEDIEDNAEIFGWNERQKLIIARRSLVGTAAMWLRSEKTYKTYAELREALMKDFQSSVNIKEMHEVLSARKKRKDETYYQYLLCIKELTKRAKFPDYIGCQYIIDGIQDEESNKTILYGATTYAVMKERLTLYEKIKIKSRNHVTVARKAQTTTSSPSFKKCYNCGDSSHLASACVKEWTKRETLWKGHEGKRARGRPKHKWSDDIVKNADENWSKSAKDR